MPTARHNRSAIYASRLLSRRSLDVRARVVALHSTAERGAGHDFIGRGFAGHGVTKQGARYSVVHARTLDVSQSGAGLTLTCELPWGAKWCSASASPAAGLCSACTRL